jgi:phosphoribosylaminoimidazole-succinocarboxamide synthase
LATKPVTSADRVVFETDLKELERLHRGKVRDIYAVDERRLLIVTTDRLSAFDVVLPDPIPGKGRVLDEISRFWFARTGGIIPNHLTGEPLSSILRDPADLEQCEGRAVIVRRLRPLPLEAVVRGYLIGSGWKDYRASGAVCGITLPPGLHESGRLPQPIFTPATKAASGHDINITEKQAADLVGKRVLERVRDLTMRLYADGAAHAESCGIIVADTKFEFGLLPLEDDDNRRVEDRVILIDEMLTPDSSRFWPRDGYAPGGPQPSFDKQFVRDYLERIGWNKQPPVPSLPDDVVIRTREKYVEAFRRLTGRELE